MNYSKKMKIKIHNYVIKTIFERLEKEGELYDEM